MIYTCKFCDKQIANKGGLAAHEPYCKANPQKQTRPKSPNAHKRKGSVPWNKGLSGLHSAWNKGLHGDPRLTGKASTPEKEKVRIEKIKKTSKTTNGGYRLGSGRGKKGWFRGFFCDSSYELAYVAYCLDHHIDIKRNTTKRKYEWNGEERTYIPDFIVNGQVVEIKGYCTKQWEAKLRCNPDIKVMYASDLQNVFEYVIKKYGKNFIALYD